MASRRTVAQRATRRRRQALFQRLQAQTLTPLATGQLRTLQRGVREWRTAIARRLAFGATEKAEGLATSATLSQAPEPETGAVGAGRSDLRGHRSVGCSDRDPSKSAPRGVL